MTKHMPITPHRRTDLGRGAWIDFKPEFVADHANVGAAVLEEIRSTLKVETIRMYGKDIPMPRATSWHGDVGDSYTYSGKTFGASPWTPTLKNIRDQLEAFTGTAYNSVLVNHYRSGEDSVSWHADDEPELGPKPDDIRIASVSLGMHRRFLLRDKAKPRQTHEVYLGGGDLLIMGGTTQSHWVHSIPKTKVRVGQRVNLTFRLRV